MKEHASLKQLKNSKKQWFTMPWQYAQIASLVFVQYVETYFLGNSLLQFILESYIIIIEL